MIGGTRGSDADSEIELPFRSKVDINGRKELLLLISQRIEAAQGTVRSVVLQSPRNFLREIVAELRIRREPHTLIHARTVEGPVQRWIERKIPPPDFLVDNRTKLQCPRVR